MIPRRAMLRPIPGLGYRAHLFPTRTVSQRASTRCSPTRYSPTRPSLPVLAQQVQGRWSAKSWESTVMGEEKCGHIAAAPNESILFFDNIFPLNFSHFIRRPWQGEGDLSELLKRFDNSSLGIMDPIKMVKRAVSDNLSIKVTEIVPRLKDGGAFVKFSHPAEISPEQVEGKLISMLNKEPIKPWFSPFRGIKAGLVNGVPWLEDLHRFPKSRLKIEFVPTAPGSEAVEQSQETLYSLFRKYGKIGDITSQPSDSKVLPKFAFVDFVMVRDAIMARNCMHGFVVAEKLGGGKAGTQLRLSYEQRMRPHRIWDWVSNHPRIVIPLLAALVAAISVVIFDPVREFFIKTHVQRSFTISNSRLYKWFKRQTSDIFTFRRQKSEQAGLSAVWSQRKDVIESVQTWLLETTDTFIIVQGPRGSGKKELILDQALKGRNDVLVLDCKPIIEARGESGTIKRLAQAVGYRPVFSWANSLSSLIDLAVQSTTGVKSGFSETLDSQLQKILQTTAAALKSVSLADRKKGDQDANLSEDAYLETHPETRAVVVIDNFLHKNEEASIVYDKIAEWAAALVQSNIAHVIFLTNDTSYSKSLSKSMPDRVFRQVALGDLSPEVAKNYIISHLENDDVPAEGERATEKGKSQTQQRADLLELDCCIDSVGGRLTDLEFLARRLKSGQTPKRAIAEMIEQNASEIIKVYLLGNDNNRATPGSGDEPRKWSSEQAWYLIREIASKESLRYNEVLLSATFASSTSPRAANGEAALEALSNAELITVHSYRGRPQTIRAGRPVYQAAFGMLLADPVLKARMDLALLTELASVEAKTIEKAENELALLGGLPRQPRQTAERVEYLLAKLQASQAKIVRYEQEMAGLKKVLSHEA